MTNDPINPKHYVNANGKQLQDYIRDLPFGYGNAIKYIVRAGHKPGVDPAQDLEKAGWYVRDARANPYQGPGTTPLRGAVREAECMAADMLLKERDPVVYGLKQAVISHLLLALTPGVEAVRAEQSLCRSINLLQVLTLRYFGDGEESDAT